MPVAAVAAPSPNAGAPLADAAPFGQQTASSNARELAAWVLKSGDNQALPFVIIDKIDAKVFVFDRLGTLQGAAAALLGLGRGDDSVPGIGQRKLATIIRRAIAETSSLLASHTPVRWLRPADFAMGPISDQYADDDNANLTS